MKRVCKSVCPRVFACLLCLLALWSAAGSFSFAADETAQDYSALVRFDSPEEKKSVRRMQDDKVLTYTKIRGATGVQCAWTDEEKITRLFLEWFETPSAFTLTQADAAGNELKRETIEDPIVMDVYPLEAETRAIEMYAEEMLSISTLRFLGEGALPEGVYDWEKPTQKADLLVISAHPDDELLYFGGTIPTYAGEEGLSVQVVYMAYDNRVRVSEAMAGLWLLGVRNAPVFAGFYDKYTETLAAAEKKWGREETTEAIVELMRRFRPEVVLTHDLAGEYGHGAHMLTAAATLDAVSIAADGSKCPASAREYGVWQIQKLYLHLCQNGTITMNWRVPLAAFDGQTALQMASLAYACHVSQQEYHQNIYDSGAYSCAEFGLAFTLVGFDDGAGDFFEHIPPERLTSYVAPTPSPEPSPEPTPEPTPKREPTPTAAPQPSEALASDSAETHTLLIALIVLFVLALCCCIAYILLRRARRKRKRRKAKKKRIEERANE